MIFYFSGTGNSFYAAHEIAHCHGEKLVSIGAEMSNKDNSFEYPIEDNEILGFVYPVYAWAPPQIVIDFIKKMKLIKGRSPYIFSVSTCGDEEGYTTKVLRKALERKGLKLDSGFTLIMPNNYILGFDVDSKDVEQEKLLRAEEELKQINTAVEKRQKGLFKLVPGKIPSLKTTLVNPLFNAFAIRTERFYATEACTGCGLCEKACSVKNITVQGTPRWGKQCTQCLACIHRCPVSAIQYGKSTIRKGRYVNPILKK